MTGIFAMTFRLGTIATFIMLCFAGSSSAAENIPSLATVDGIEISRERYELAVYEEARQIYYHGAPGSNEDYLAFRRKVANSLVDRTLLLREARNRSVSPDQESVAAKLAVYADRYGDTEQWKSDSEIILAKLRERFEEDSMLDNLESIVRETNAPEESVVRDYYKAHPEKFTEPDRNQVAVILLAVTPTSGEPVWEVARQEAADIIQRIQDGGSFAELAKMHSADPSAENGGDMGYLHAGTLSSEAQAAVDKLAVSDVSEPVTVLEGIAIFQLIDRQEAALKPFEAVRERAAGLWRRDAADEAWAELISELRTGSSIELDEAYLDSLSAMGQ